MLLANKPIGTIAYMDGLPAHLRNFTWSLVQMIQFNAEALCGPGEYVHYDRATDSFHSFARNNLAERMLGDWLLMLDTDHEFAPDLAVRMLDRLNVYKADVLVGFYQHKARPYAPVIYMRNKRRLFAPIGAWDTSADVLQIDSAGAGCLMVRREVFERIRKKFKQGPFDITPPLGEDHSFFQRCGELGIKVLCDPRVQAPHLRIAPVTLEDYRRDEVVLAKPQKVRGWKGASCLSPHRS